MAKTISIIGLGQIGTAATFALGRYAEQLSLQAYEPDPAIRQRTLQAGALCEMSTEVKQVIQTADVVLDCSPYTSVKKNLIKISETLPEEAIYCCCAPNKRTLSKLFGEFGGVRGNFFGLVISTNRDKWRMLSAKRVIFDAELFAGASIGISTSATAGEKSIKRALDLVELLGGQGVLMDHEEADLIEDRMLISPILAVNSAISAAITESGWGENKNFANYGFGRSLELLGIESPEDLAEILIDAPDGVSRWMAARRQAEKQIENAILTGDTKKLTTYLAQSSAERSVNEAYFNGEQIQPKEEPRSLKEKMLKRFVRNND